MVIETDPKTFTATRPAALLRKRVRLEVVRGPDASAVLEIDQRARVGSRELADLKLTDPKVSGLHFEVTAGAELRLKDLGSKNGTFVARVRVIEALLTPGDVVTVGDTQLRVGTSDAEVEVALHPADDFHGIIGGSNAMRELTAQIARAADSSATVLIQGETGTGKERVAEALHTAGRRAGSPLVVVDCASLPLGLIESQLFGHERGAFTGATAAQPGAFENADGGTLFLDEIGELPLDLQPKLLRALESKQVQRLGAARPKAVDVRVVAATNRDLALEVTRGRFREDLYYRLAVVTLRVPPLRERLDDVSALAARFLEGLGVSARDHLSPTTAAALRAYDWPGNVRELRNTIERAVALMLPLAPQPGAVSSSSRPASTNSIDLDVPFRDARQAVLDAFERAYLTAALAASGGNVSETARRAGVDRMALHRSLQRLGLGLASK